MDKIVGHVKYLQEQKLKDTAIYLPKILKFQENVAKGIKTFVDLAKEQQITGVNCPQISTTDKDSKSIRVLNFTLDNQDLSLVMCDDIYYIDFDSDSIGNKSFVYLDGNPNSTPIIEIVIYFDCDQVGFYSANWFSRTEKKMITGKMRLDENGGDHTAESIISFFYNQRRCWKNQPTKDEFYSDKRSKGTMGFLSEQ